MKSLLLMCCFLAVTSASLFAQTNPVSQVNFMSKVNQLNTLLTQGNLPAAEVVWSDLNNMMMVEQNYVKERLNNAIVTGDPGQQTQYTNIAGQEATYYSEAVIYHADMILNQPALINRLNQFAATIL